MRKQRFEQPEPVRRFAPDVPAELEQIMLQLLEKEPQRRIANATLLGRRLETLQQQRPAIIAGQSTQAAPSPTAADEEVRHLSQVDLLAPTRGVTADVPPPAPAAAPPAENAGQEIAVPSAPESVKAPARFVRVAADELDRDEPTPAEPVISLHTLLLAASVLAIGFTVWHFLRPPSADDLYRRITARVAENSVESLLLCEDDIRSFLSSYPGDPRAAELHEHEKRIDLYYLERKLEKRAADSRIPIEKDYLEAVRYMRLNPEQGIEKLQALVDLYDKPEPQQGTAALCVELARQRLKPLREEIAQRAAQHLKVVENRLEVADGIREGSRAGGRDVPRGGTALHRQAVGHGGRAPRPQSAGRDAAEGRNTPEAKAIKPDEHNKLIPGK